MGTGNTIGLQLGKGATASIGSTCTLSGSTEISVDGSGSSYAEMRTATPKVKRDSNFGTMFYE